MEIGNPQKTFIERGAALAAFIIPAVLGILSASPEPYWLDSSELTAAVFSVGIPHPPGYPLYVISAKIFTLIPIGSIPFRVSLASVIFGASASFLLFRMCFKLIITSVRSLPIASVSLLSLCAALFAFSMPAWWSQCVKQEVYSLQILLMLGWMYSIMLFCISDSRSKDRFLYFAAFIGGLSFCNHHFMAAVAIPAAVPILVSLSGNKGGLGATLFSLKLLAIGLSGLFPYLLIPIRSASGAAVAFGGVQSYSDMLFVMTARAFQKLLVTQYQYGLNESASSHLVKVFSSLGIWFSAAGVLGFLLLIRTRRTRLWGIFLLLSVVVHLILRTTMMFDPHYPDYAGYIVPIIAIITLSTAVFTAVTLYAIFNKFSWAEKYIFSTLCVLLGLIVLKTAISRTTVDLSSYRATRIVTDFAVYRSPPGTLLIISDFSLFSAIWSTKHIDGHRPDVSAVNPLLLNHPGYFTSELSQRPDLAPLVRSVLVHNTFTESALVDTTLNRPLRVEPLLSYKDDSADRYLIPDGPLYRAYPQPSSTADVAAGILESSGFYKQLYHLLGTSWQEPETLKILANIHYRDALFLARAGNIEGALRASDAVSALKIEHPKLDILKDLLENNPKGSIDISELLKPL